MADSSPNPRPLTLFGDSGTSTPGVDSTIGTFQVGCSGESIIFRPSDAQGSPLAITGLRNTDDVQILSVAGSTTASTMTLSLGGQTTTPIPLAPLPPLTSWTATVTLPAPGTYDIGFSYGYYGVPPTGRACPRTLLQVFDGPTLAGSVVVDQSKYPDPAVDLVVEKVGVFKAMGSYTSTTGTMTFWLSGDAGNSPILSGHIRIVPHGSTDPSLVGYVDPTCAPFYAINGNLAGRITIQRYGNWLINYSYTADDWHGFYYAAPTGNQATALPTTDDLRTALQALPSLPPGSLDVTAASNQSIQIHFTGLMGGRAFPTLVAPDPAFQITHDDSGGSSVGGQFPSVTINGTPHLLRAATFASGQPVVAFHLVQDTPAVQFLGLGEGSFGSVSYPPILRGVGFSHRTAAPTSAGPVAICPFEGLSGPADYEVALTWPGGDAAADRLECVVEDSQGNVLSRLSNIDQTATPGDFQDQGFGWSTVGRVHLPAAVNKITVMLNGAGTAGRHCLIDAIRLARTSPDVGAQIAAGDVVLFNAPSGFVSTAAGPMPAAQSLRVLPAPARRLPPLPPKLRTMKLGTNCSPPFYFEVDSTYSNYAIMGSGPIGLAQGPDGYPTRLAADPYNPRGAAALLLTVPAQDCGGKGLGVANSTAGTWVVQWSTKLDIECVLVARDDTTTVVEDLTRRVQGPTPRRYFNITTHQAAAPSLYMQVLGGQLNPDGSYACDLQNLGIYPPDVDPDHPGKWRPSFLAKIKDFQCFRFMDFFGTNNLNLATFDQFPTPARFPLGYAGRSIAVPIVSIGPPEPDRFSESVSGTVVRVTTAVPHGLTTGFSVGLRTTDGTSLGLVQGNVIDQTTRATTTTPRDAIDPTDGYRGYLRGLCHVIDATTFQLGLEVYYGPPARMINTLTPAHGIVYADIAPGAMMAPSDAAELCAEAGLEPWVNVPWLADDDCVTRLAEAFVAQTPPGVAVHVEYGNEPWNYFFIGCICALKLDTLTGGPGTSPYPFYIRRMGQVHQIFRQVWQQAGRDVTEIRRVCGALQANPGTTSDAFQLAIAQGITFDELTVASYFNSEPLQGTFDDLLTREQFLDVLALNIELGVTASQMASHQQLIASTAAANPSLNWIGQLQLVNYEGGSDVMTTQSTTANIARRNHAIHRHPDFMDILLHWLDKLERAGVRLFNAFTLFRVHPVSQWGVYEAFNMLPGTGLAALDGGNISDPEDIPNVVSQAGAAFRQWRAWQVPASPGTTVTSRTGLTTIGRRAYGSSGTAA